MTTALIVSSKELLPALKQVKKLCKPQPGEEAILSFDGQCLHIELGGMSVAPAAKGSWNGQARVPGTFLINIAKLPPSGDPIQIRVSEGRLHLGTTSIGCRWQDAWSKLIVLPMNATKLDLLALRFQHSDEEIAASGFSESVADARKWQAKKLEFAMQHLKAFNISPRALEMFVDAQLRSQATAPESQS